MKNAAYGKVFIVGAGPGDPDLLTIKALTILQRADIVFVDRLVSAEIKALIPASCIVKDVGKAPGDHTLSQDQINEAIVHAAKQGLEVCRLKGGDPFVFGRGGEEQLAAQAAGLAVEVVPGITAALGCAAAAGIPLTHRGMSQSVTFVTGHAAKELNVNWRALAGKNQTVVFYMAIKEARRIQTQLVNRGLAASTPIAVIERGTCKEQRVLKSQLGRLHEVVENKQVQAPAILVIGDVAELAAVETRNLLGDLGADELEAGELNAQKSQELDVYQEESYA